MLEPHRIKALIFFWCLMLAGLFGLTAILMGGEALKEKTQRELECVVAVGIKPPAHCKAVWP